MGIESGWTAEKIAKWLNPAPQLSPVLERWRELGLSEMLDRGCGPGRHAVFFAKNGFSVTALDRSAEALAYLHTWAEGLNLSVQTVQGDILTMPFPDASFDCVLDFHASFHTDTAGYMQGVRELRRVLRPGGEAYVTLKSKQDSRYLQASLADRPDRFTLLHQGKEPHVYAALEELPELFPGFTFVNPPAEVREPGMASPEERVHYHLLLRKS